MNKRLKKVLSYALITSMVASMALTNFGGRANASVVKADGEQVLDSASLVNFSTILGRAVDFGILADTYDQTKSHSETNMAVNKYINDKQYNDPDLAGSEAMPYIIGELQGQLKLGTFPSTATTTNKMIINIETQKSIIDASTSPDPIVANIHENADGSIYVPGNDDGSDKPAKFGKRGVVELVYRTASLTSINNNINLMIDHIQKESTALKDHEKTNNLSYSSGTLDLSDDKYKGKVVYVNVSSTENADIYNRLNEKSGGILTIKKHDSTVVVFNIAGGKEETKPLTIQEFSVVDENGNNSIATNQQTNTGNDSEENRKIDSKINQKVIFNLYEAKYVIIENSAGTFLVPTKESQTTVLNSAGWMASAGTVKSAGEWHYLYRGRSKTVSSYENGKMHFAAKKAFASQLPDNMSRSDVESAYKVTSIDITPNQYKFSIYESDSSYNIGNKIGSSIGNDAQSKLIFPDLEFTQTGDYYYVIKEDNPGAINNVSGGTVTNSSGRIDIKITVFKEDSTLRFKITSDYYMQDGYTSAKSNDEQIMNGNEFSLGDFYNLYTETPTGELKISKTQATGSDPIADDAKFTINVTATESNGTPLAGKYTTNITPGNTAGSVTFNAGAASVELKKGETITISGLPEGSKITGVSEGTLPTPAAGGQYGSPSIEPGTISTTSPLVISSNNPKVVTVANTYTAPKGSIKFEKHFDFNCPDTEKPTEDYISTKLSGLKFKVIYENGQAVQEFTLSNMTPTPGTYTWTIDINDLPIGPKYTVEEVADTSGLTGFSAPSVTRNPEQDGVAAKQNDPNTYAMTNTYTKLYDVTVEKYLEGDTVTLPDTFKITTSCTSNSNFDGIVLQKSGAIGTNPYTWTIYNVPYGTSIDFKETGAEVSGYDLKVYDAPSSASGRNVLNKDTTDNSYKTSATVGTINVVPFANEYTRQKTSVTLEKKWVVNDNGAVADSITVQLFADGAQVGSDIVLKKGGSFEGSLGDGITASLAVADESKTWTFTVEKLNKYSDSGQQIAYTWNEVVPNNVNYELSIATTPDENNKTTFTNTSPVQQHGSLTIKKTVNANGATTPSSFGVTIQDESGKFYNANGVCVGTTSQPIIDVPANGSATVNNLLVQKYIVKEVETSAQVSGYKLKTEYTGLTEGKIQLVANEAKEVSITNTYTQVGALMVEKVQADGSDTIPAGTKFPIQVKLPAGEYTYTLSTASNVLNPVSFDGTNTHEFKLAVGENVIIYDIPTGSAYSVAETLPNSYYSVAYTHQSGITNAYSIVDKMATATVTNTYTEPKGTLTITKDIAGGLDESSAEIGGKKYKFTVTGPNSYSQTVELPDSNGGWSATLSDLKLGTYTISETVNDNIKVDHYTLVADSDVSPVFTVDNLEQSVVMVNKYTYEPTVQDAIDITVDKINPSNEHLSGATLQIQKLDGTVVHEWTTTGSQDIKSLQAGDYKLVEKTAPRGYQIASPIAFSVVKVTDTANNVTLSLKDADGNVITGITMTDAPVLKHDVKISKVDITNSREIVGAHLILYKDNGGGSYSQLYEWDSEINVRSFPLEAGDYAIKETVAPAGYEPAITLVKFNLSFDNQGKAIIVITDNDHNGTYDAAADVIKFEDDPIKVTGKLSVHVEEKKTGRPVPDAEVEVTDEKGNTTTYKTNGEGNIVDNNGNKEIDVPAGKYKIKVKSVPKGYEVAVGETAEVVVPENDKGEHIAKIVSSTGGLKIKVLEEGTNREVPDATVVVEAPEGVKFPDGSTKITAVTDKNGNITTYTGADGKTYDLTSGLTPGDYKITVTKVPAGYQVTTGETKTKKVVKDEVAEHVALIATSSSVKPAPAPAPAPAATPAATPATPTGSITNSINVKTGDDMNVYPALIAMALSLITGVSVVAFRRKRETK